MKWPAVLTGLLLTTGVFGQDAKSLPASVELEYTPTLTVSGRGEVFATLDRAIETPVQPGELRVEASVTLRYEIIP